MHKFSYQPGHSYLHRLYPITKLIALLVISFLIFFIHDGFILIGFALLLFILMMLTLKFNLKIRGIRFVILTALLLFLLYLLFDKSGAVVYTSDIDLLTVTQGGIKTGLEFSGRFLSIVFLSYLFVLSTDSSDLAYALMKFGVPYRLAFMLVTALRMAPQLEQEGQTIYRAQLVRGVQYDRPSPRRLILLVKQFLTPLLISALRKADKLVFSMEGRGFGQYPTRTYRRKSHPTWRDTVLIFVLAALIAFTLIFITGGLF